MTDYKLYDDKLPDDAFEGTELECDYSKEESRASVGYWKDGNLTIIVHGNPPKQERETMTTSHIMRYIDYMEKEEEPLTFHKWMNKPPVDIDRLRNHIDACIDVYERLKDS